MDRNIDRSMDRTLASGLPSGVAGSVARGVAWGMVLLAAAGASLPALTLARASEIEQFVDRAMQDWQIPGMAVALLEADKAVYQGGFGVTQADGKAVDEHTLFAIASTTKAMVGAATMLLVDDGLVELDDRVATHLPTVRFATPELDRQITIRDLLSHQTGLPSTDVQDFVQQFSLDEKLDRLRHVHPVAPLRTKHIYQNLMFELAGLVIESVSGKPWHEFVRDRLWSPIGMKETYGALGLAPKRRARVAGHYVRDGEVLETTFELDNEVPVAAGSVWSSLHDMSLWVQFILRGGITESGEQLISKESFEELFRPQALIGQGDFYPTTELTQPSFTSYGLGWFQQDFQGRKIDYHTGSLPGLVALVGVDRASNRGIVFLANRDHAEARHAYLWTMMDNGAMGRDWHGEVLALYQPANDANPSGGAASPLTNTSPGLPLEAYTGVYSNPAWGEMEVKLTEDTLHIVAGATDMPLSHWHLDVFLFESEEFNARSFATFAIGPSGRTTQLTFFGQPFVRQ